MKKQILATVIVMMPALGFAKVSDFNAIIADNMKEQTQLHNTVQGEVIEARQVSRKTNVRDRIVIVENSSTTYNAPTKKDLLKFKKEKQGYSASQQEQLGRLANEIHNSEE